MSKVLAYKNGIARANGSSKKKKNKSTFKEQVVT